MTANNSPTFFKQLNIQNRVIWALIMREIITRYGREGLGVIWLVLEPAMFIVGVMIIFSQIHSDRGALEVAEYLSLSYPTMLLWRNGTGRVTKAIEVNMSLLHYRPIRPMDIIYSRIILEFAGTTATFIVLYSIFVAIGICQFPADLFTMLIGWIMVMWFSFAFVLTMAALAELSDTIERSSHIILYLMIPFSGVFVPAHLVPEPYRDYLLYTPLVNCVEWFYSGYYGQRMETYYYPEYTIAILLGFTLFAYSLTNISINRVQTR